MRITKDGKRGSGSQCCHLVSSNWESNIRVLGTDSFFIFFFGGG